MDFSNYTGELAALATAVFWTITAMAFEVGSKNIGSLALNMIRLVLAFIFLSVFNLIVRGLIFPVDASVHAWVWLSVSGLVGFVFGDYFLFRAFAAINARIAMLFMTLVPPITAVIGWALLGETMTTLEVTGMVLTISGIAMAIFSRGGENGKKIKLSYPVKGILFGMGGALGQAVGLVLSKYGMGDYHAFAATQIRIIAGMIGFAMIIIVLKKGYLIRKAFKSRPGMIGTGIGSVFGPFLGVSFSLIAVKYASTGVASTLMSIVPILIIPPAVLFFKQKVSWLEVLGAFISVSGVSLFFI
ncbi:MAG: EamA family transporter [Bacteroidetes bacterium]|nr:MAG: EamA family transporter [Bacteroidota bacterium]RLD80906.1 MAG: EamA family transporter [Bacteroidota bacterium]